MSLSFSGLLDDLVAESRRFIQPDELARFTLSCSLHDDTVYVMEYEGALVEQGRLQMDANWAQAFRGLKDLGIIVHLLAECSADDVIAAEGEDVFHQIHQCADDQGKARAVQMIRDADPDVNLVCVGTAFLYLVRSFRDGDFVYYVQPFQSLPRHMRGSGTTQRYSLSMPIHIHRLYVFCLITITFFFATTGVATIGSEVQPDDDTEYSPENTGNEMS